MFPNPISVAGTQRTIAHLKEQRIALLNGRTPQALSEQEKLSFINFTTQIERHNEELRTHEAESIPAPRVPGVLYFGGDQPREDRTENGLRNILRSAFTEATSEQREEITELAAYLRGKTVASANLTPGSDGGLLIPSFVQGVIERNYSQFSPVVNACRLFTTETGAPQVFARL